MNHNKVGTLYRGHPLTPEPPTMSTTIQSRPATSSLSPSQVSLILYHSPARAVDHLVHAWATLAELGPESSSGRRASRLAYARTRLECLRSEAVARAVKPWERRAVEVEALELEGAILRAEGASAG